MKSLQGIAFACFALGLAACQGGFSGGGGTSMPGGITPPVNNPGPQNVPISPTPQASPTGALASGTQGANGAMIYPFSQATDGMKCPEQNGFSCVIRFNLPPETPTPSPAPSGKQSGKPTPTPSPTPTPTPTPSPNPSASGSASPSPSPTPTSKARISLTMQSLPTKNVPAMVNPDAKAVSTTALIALHVSSDADVLLQGRAVAEFTLPAEQIGGRGFAIQLFHETVKNKKVSDTFVGSFAKSKLDGNTLHFELVLPPLTVKKAESWLFVLYGDEVPSSSASPSASGSASPSASPSASASASPSPTASTEP